MSSPFASLVRKHPVALEVYLRVFEDSPHYSTISRLADGCYVDVNPGFQKFTGYSHDEAVGRTAHELGIWPYAHERDTLIAEIRRSGGCQGFACHLGVRSGDIREVELGASIIKIEGEAYLVAVVHDVTERRRYEAELAQHREQLEQLVAQRTQALQLANAELQQAHAQLVESERLSRHQSQHDALTGLPNRLLLHDRVEHALLAAERNHESLALLFIDLDNFKNINDTLGHMAGDSVLRIVAGQLLGCVRKSDTVARLGGDEFVIALSGLTAQQDASVIAQKVLQALEGPFEVQGREFRGGASIGISVYPADGGSVELLMQAADTAMYHAKALGKNNYQFHSIELQRTAQNRYALDNEMRQALVRNEFLLHFQPQVDMATGKVLGLEALIRWQHPQRGMVPPMDFIGLAEETGLIVPLGEWVLREACTRLRQWHDLGHTTLRVAVNMSPRQVWKPGFVESVQRVLMETGLPAGALDIEITEGLLMQPNPENVAILDRLVALGVHLHVDDFGTGYSSLGYLKSFPIHALKIDRSFVRGITDSRRDLAIASTIIAMAKHLQLELVAEGVETCEQAELLLAHGCRVAQGYLYSKPVPAEQVEALLTGVPLTLAA